MVMDLTPRERTVLVLLREGMSQSEIAKQLRVTQPRVSQVVRSLVAKGVVDARKGGRDGGEASAG